LDKQFCKFEELLVTLFEKQENRSQCLCLDKVALKHTLYKPNFFNEGSATVSQNYYRMNLFDGIHDTTHAFVSTA